MKMSRNVDVHALQHFLRSLPQHGAKMKELLLQLLQLFNLEDPETATPRTADRFVDSSSLLDKIAPGMGGTWRDCHFHPDDATSPVDGLLSDTMFFDSSGSEMIDTGHQNE